MPYIGQSPAFSNAGGALSISGAPVDITGNTNIAGQLNMADNKVSRAMLSDVGYAVTDKGTVGTGTVTFDITGGNVQKLTVSGALTIAISNWPPTGNLGEILLKITNGGVATVTWPSINWVMPDGKPTTVFATFMTAIGRSGLQASGTDFVLLWTDDAGLTIYGKVL